MEPNDDYEGVHIMKHYFSLNCLLTQGGGGVAILFRGSYYFYFRHFKETCYESCFFVELPTNKKGSLGTSWGISLETSWGISLGTSWGIPVFSTMIALKKALNGTT